MTESNKVNNKKFSGAAVKILLSLFGIILILSIVYYFSFKENTTLKDVIINSDPEHIIEPLYYLFVFSFLLFAVIWPFYLYIIAGRIKGIGKKFIVYCKIAEKEAKEFENSISTNNEIDTSCAETKIDEFVLACGHNRALKRIWEQYKETFIGNGEHKDKIKPYYKKFIDKTRSNADLYFNTDEIVRKHYLKLPVISFLKLIAGSFVGLGILGTFIGFSQALSNGINIQNQDDLNIIVDGLKVAFNTSIFGIFSSIIYNFLVVHPIIQLLNERSRTLCDVLDSKYYVSDEECFRSLGDIVFETGDSITSSSNDMAKKVADAILEGRESFTAELNKTTDTLKEVSSELGKTPDAIKVMNEELKESVNTVKENYQEMLVVSISTIEDKISSLFTTFANRFDESSENISSSILSIKGLPDEFRNVINESNGTLKESITDLISNTKDEFSNLVKDIFDSVQNELNTSSSVNLENTKAMLTETGKEFSSISDSMKDNFKKFIDEANIGMESILDNVKEQIKDTYEGYETSVVSLVNKIETTSEKFTDVTEDYSNIEESLKNISEDIKAVEVDLTSSITALFDEIPSKIEDLVDKLQRSALLTNESTSYIKDISLIPEKVEDLLSMFEKSVNTINATYIQTLEGIQNLYNYCVNKEADEANILRNYVEKIDSDTMSKLLAGDSILDLKKDITGYLNRIDKKIENINEKKELLIEDNN